MRELVRSGSTLLNRGLRYPLRSDAQHSTRKKLKSTNGNTLAKQQISMPVAPRGWDTKAWTNTSWPTDVISKTPDGKFGPASRIGEDYHDSWFLSCLAAVVNDLDGNRQLAKNISRENNGYKVRFEGLPTFGISVSDNELKKWLDTEGGDADTRLLELAAHKLFQIKGTYKSLFLAACKKGGLTIALAEEAFDHHCNQTNIKDPMTYNPIRSGGMAMLGLFMLTGKYPDTLLGHMKMKSSDIIKYLHKHVKNDWDHPTVVITGRKNPLGDNHISRNLVINWDAIRTDITMDGKLDSPERTFLQAMNNYLEYRTSGTLEAFVVATQKLKLKHADPVKFFHLLYYDMANLEDKHVELLQHGIKDILYADEFNKKDTVVGSNDESKRKLLGGSGDWSGSGYIGFSGFHTGYLTGIDEDLNLFTYSEPAFPTIQHNGILSDLVEEIQRGEVALSSVEAESIECPIF